MSVKETGNAKQAAWVAVGNFFSFVIGIASPMILSRYFDKGDYGTYKQVMYVYNTLLTVFTLGLPKAYAYFLPRYSREFSKDIISKVTKLFFILGSLFSLCLLLFASPIATAMKNPDLKGALVCFSPTPFFLLPTMGLDAIYASFRKTKYLAYYTIATRVLTIVCIVLPVVVFSGNYIHAIIGFDVASLITFLLALYLKTWPVRNEKRNKSSLTYREIFRYSLPLLYASLFGVIISSANQFFISRYYGNEVFAEFSNGFMEIPFVGMIMGAISTVLLPLFSGMDKGNGMNSEALAVWESSLIKSAKLIFPMLIYSIFFAKIIVTCMYGDLYEQSSIYFLIKNISSLFCVLPFYPIILAIGKTKDYARVHMLIAIIIVVLELLVCHIFDSAVSVAIVSELCHLLKIYLLIRVISIYSGCPIKVLVPPEPMSKLLLLSIAAAILPFALLSFVEMNKFIALFISLLLFVFSYYILCWIFKETYKDVMGSLFRKGGSFTSAVMKILP